MKKRVFLIISGRVQGVFYRAFVKKQAIAAQVSGTVHNEDNGNVGVIAEGEKDALEQFIKSLNKGPLLSKVKDIKMTWLDFQDEFYDFRII